MSMRMYEIQDQDLEGIISMYCVYTKPVSDTIQHFKWFTASFMWMSMMNNGKEFIVFEH